MANRPEHNCSGIQVYFDGVETHTHESYFGHTFNSIHVEATGISRVMLEPVDLRSDEWISLIEVRCAVAVAAVTAVATTFLIVRLPSFLRECDLFIPAYILPITWMGDSTERPGFLPYSCAYGPNICWSSRSFRVVWACLLRPHVYL